MSIFAKFATKEELLEAVSQAIKSDKGEDGTETFYIEDETGKRLTEIEKKFEEEVKNAKYQRSRAQKAEEKVSELTTANARLEATNQEFSQYNPEKQREEIARLLSEIGVLKADNKALTDKIQPLNNVIAEYRARENAAIIDEALRSEATRLGVRPEAIRDVLYRRSMLEVSDVGTVQTKDGVPIQEFMEEEYKNSPLWHPLSAGGGSSPGTSSVQTDSATRYAQAKATNNVIEMLKNAPEFHGTQK